MKKITLLLVSLVVILSAKNTYGQLLFIETPDSVSYVGQLYQDTVEAITDIGNYPITYSLDVALSGMVINSSSGAITWTPSGISSGGRVVIRATNNIALFETKEIFLYVSDAIECPGSLTAYWKLDETSGPTFDDWMGTNNAIALVNSPSDSTGRVGKSQSFNPANSEGLSVADNDIFDWATDENFSVELWFNNNIESFDSVAILIGRNEGSAPDDVHWWVGLDDTEKLNFIVRKEFGVEPAMCTSPNAVGSGWHHVVAVRHDASNSVNLYLDGSLVDSDTYTGTGPGLSSAEAITIGWLKPGLGDNNHRYPYSGKIDDVKIYSVALSLSDIVKTYTNGLNGRPACQNGNFAPIIKSVPVQSVDQDQPYSYKIVAKDLDAADVLTYTVENKPEWLNYNGTTKTLSGTPVNANVGSTLVRIKVSDSKVDIFQNYTLTVKNLNDAPVITSLPVIVVPEEQAYMYQVVASDIDAGDHLTYSAPVKPAWLSINVSTGLVTGTAPLNDTAAYSVTIRVTDDSAAFAEQIFTLDVRNVNDAPVILGQPALETDEDVALDISLLSVFYEDIDNSASQLTLTAKNGLNYFRSGNTITPAANYHGPISVPVELSDGEYSDTDTLEITVNPVNDEPEIISAPSGDANPEQQYVYVFEAEDADTEDVLLLSVTKKPSWLTFNADLKILSGKPKYSDAGIDTVTLSVTDGKATVSGTYYITVTSSNHVPHITSTPPAAGTTGELYSYSISFTDEDAGDVLTLSAPELPAWLTLNAGSAMLSGTPSVADLGSDAEKVFNVVLKISDGKQDSTQTFSITVKKASGIHDFTPALTRLYPVPAVEYVRFELNTAESLTLEIMDITGKTVYSGKIDASTSVFEVNVASFREGIYMYKLYNSNNFSSGKLTINR